MQHWPITSEWSSLLFLDNSDLIWELWGWPAALCHHQTYIGSRSSVGKSPKRFSEHGLVQQYFTILMYMIFIKYWQYKKFFWFKSSLCQFLFFHNVWSCFLSRSAAISSLYRIVVWQTVKSGNRQPVHISVIFLLFFFLLKSNQYFHISTIIRLMFRDYCRRNNQF